MRRFYLVADVSYVYVCSTQLSSLLYYLLNHSRFPDLHKASVIAFSFPLQLLTWREIAINRYLLNKYETVTKLSLSPVGLNINLLKSLANNVIGLFPLRMSKSFGKWAKICFKLLLDMDPIFLTNNCTVFISKSELNSRSMSLTRLVWVHEKKEWKWMLSHSAFSLLKRWSMLCILVT